MMMCPVIMCSSAVPKDLDELACRYHLTMLDDILVSELFRALRSRRIYDLRTQAIGLRKIRIFIRDTIDAQYFGTYSARDRRAALREPYGGATRRDDI